MQKVLVLFAHPRFEQSRINRVLVQSIRNLPGVTFRDLYDLYPDFDIDVPAEQELLKEHDIIIWQHPLYWYSCPPLLKQWIDLVLTYGWAYGSEGTALADKKCLQVITAGGSRDVYCAVGKNYYTINTFLRPFEQTARLCNMEYLPPFAIMGTHRLDEKGLQDYATQYRQIIEYVQAGKSLLNLSSSALQQDLPTLNC